MKADPACLVCLLGKTEKRLRNITGEDRKRAAMRAFLKVLCVEGERRTATWLNKRGNELFEEAFGCDRDYRAIKRKFNRFLMEREGVIRQRIGEADDRLAAAIRFTLAGNYIDTAAVDEVKEETLLSLLERAETEKLDGDELKAFRDDLAGARNVVYLTDNCGEIVCDRLLIEEIKREYPRVTVTAILKTGLAENDATLEDAVETGLHRVAECIGTGTDQMGTDLDEISEEAREKIKGADVVIAKGQANFETLYGTEVEPYYLFLCKCELFTRKFGLERFQGVFKKS